jgi:voltage-gated potassium channel
MSAGPQSCMVPGGMATWKRIRAHLRSGWGRGLPGTLANVLTSIGLLALVLETSPTASPGEQRFLFTIILAVWAWIAGELVFQLWTAGARRGRRAYLVSADGLIDLAGALALPLGWALLPDPRDATLFAVVWALRYIRHTAGLAMLWRILRRSSTALLSVAMLFLIVFLIAATLAYVFERDSQPEAFGSIPRAMWWAIVTLTTTGYGDLVPVTIWGRLLAGWLMVGGIVLFALQAGIIASAFVEELQRRHFLHTWDLVTTVPFFQQLGAAAVADIVRLLQSRDVAPGTVILRRGDPGDAMYFIVSGEVSVLLSPEPITLGAGAFFGEMALLFGTPRSATVVATAPSVLLVLDIADFRELAGRRPELVNIIETEGQRRRDANLVADKA